MTMSGIEEIRQTLDQIDHARIRIASALRWTWGLDEIRTWFKTWNTNLNAVPWDLINDDRGIGDGTERVLAEAESVARTAQRLTEPFHHIDFLPDGVWISTVYDGRIRPTSGPYETVIFDLVVGQGENHCTHWRTEEMAASGHRKYVWLLSHRLREIEKRTKE